MSHKNRIPVNPGAPNALATPLLRKGNPAMQTPPPPSFYCKHCNGTKMYLPDTMALGKIITKVSRCKRL